MNRNARALVWAGSILNILFLWILPIYVTQDGPSHLYNAHIFNDLLFGDGFYAEYFAVNAAIYPNWTGTLVLSFLTALFPPLLAEKLFLSLLMGSFIFTSVLVVKRISPQNLVVALGIIFLTQNYFFILGFYNYILSIALLNLVIYKSLGPGSSPAWKAFIEWFVLSVLIFFTHPVAFLLAVGYIFSKDIIGLLFDNEKTPHRNHFLRNVIFWTPSILLFVVYFLNIESSGEDSLIVMNLSASTIMRLFGLRYMHAFGGVERVIYGLFGMIIFVALAFHYKSWFNKQWFVKYGGLVAVWACCLLVFFFVNDVFAGGSFFARRITLIFYMVTIYMLASFEIQTKWKIVLGMSPLLLLLVLLAVRFPRQWDYAKVTEAYIESAVSIPNGSTIMPLQVSKRTLGPEGNDMLGPSPFLHISGYLAAEKQLLSLDNYEARTTYFPIKWVDGKNPYDFIQFEDPSDQWNFALLALGNYEAATNSKVDYVPMLGDNSRTDVFESIMGTQELVDQNEVYSLYKLND